jgi:hypothetical protein
MFRFVTQRFYRIDEFLAIEAGTENYGLSLFKANFDAFYAGAFFESASYGRRAMAASHAGNREF